MLSRPCQYVPEFHSSVIWAMKWRNLPRLWLFQMLHAHCRPRKYFRVLHVPIRTKLLSANARLSCAVFAVWLIANSTAFAQTVQGSAAQPATLPDPTGEWMVAQQVARIKIADCDGRLWGVVAWEAKPGTDVKNPDPNLRSRPTLGMPILLGMAPNKQGSWDNNKSKKWEGQIYNSEDGHTYSASISLVDPIPFAYRDAFLVSSVAAKTGLVSSRKTRSLPLRHNATRQSPPMPAKQPAANSPSRATMYVHERLALLRGFPMSAG